MRLRTTLPSAFLLSVGPFCSGGVIFGVICVERAIDRAASSGCPIAVAILRKAALFSSIASQFAKSLCSFSLNSSIRSNQSAASSKTIDVILLRR